MFTFVGSRSCYRQWICPSWSVLFGKRQVQIEPVSDYGPHFISNNNGKLTDFCAINLVDNFSITKPITKKRNKTFPLDSQMSLTQTSNPVFSINCQSLNEIFGFGVLLYSGLTIHADFCQLRLNKNSRLQFPNISPPCLVDLEEKFTWKIIPAVDRIFNKG